MNATTHDASLEFCEGPVYLSGPPQQCTGMVTVRNAGSQRVRLRRLAARAALREAPPAPAKKTPAAKAKKRAKTGTSEAAGSDANPAPTALHANARLALPFAPGEQRRFPLTLALDPGTPPGIYTATLSSDTGASCEATLEVLASPALLAAPQAVSLDARPGATAAFEVTLSNTGNVPVEVPTGVAVEFHSSRGINHQFHAAARASGREGYEAFLNDFVGRVADEEPPPGAARITRGAGPLAPGQTERICIELSLPKGLKAGRTYRVHIALGAAYVAAVVHTAAPTSTTNRSA